MSAPITEAISVKAVDETLATLTDAAIAFVNMGQGGYADEVEQSMHTIRALRSALTAGAEREEKLEGLLFSFAHYAKCTVDAFSGGKPYLDMTLFPGLISAANEVLKEKV